MKNIGPKSSEWPASLGIHTLDDVARLGVVETYQRVKAAQTEKGTLNMRWGLQSAQAALLNLPWNELPPDIKEALRQQVEDSLPSLPPLAQHPVRTNPLYVGRRIILSFCLRIWGSTGLLRLRCPDRAMGVEH